MPRLPLSQRPLVFVDVETTSLEPPEAEIIEIAMIRDWPDGRTEVFHYKVTPQHIETAHPKALEVNGYTPETWVGSVPFTEIANTVHEWLTDCVIVGQNPQFDLKHIKHALTMAGVEKIKIGYHAIDTCGLIWEHLCPLGLESLSLTAALDFLGWGTEGAHTALVDTQNCRKLYELLLRAEPGERDLWRSDFKRREAQKDA